MAERLFEDLPPKSGSRILYPGCGTAPFAEAVERMCETQGWLLPEGHAVETNSDLLSVAAAKGLQHVTFAERDFLSEGVAGVLGAFDYIVGNPPYVPIEALSEGEKARYRSGFDTAVGRFDLYLLFFERALDLLAPKGRLSFVTPEKWEYVQTAAPLRKILSGERFHIEEVEHIAEDAFEGLVTYPTVTTVRRSRQEGAQVRHPTRVQLRNGTQHTLELPKDEGSSWAALIRGASSIGNKMDTGVTLGDVTVRVSPGMATGADAVFVAGAQNVPAGLGAEWTRPTVSGRQLAASSGPNGAESVLICPYRDDGTLAPESELGAFGQWASRHRERLEDRSCVQKHGKAWMEAHCQRAANGFLRLQSRVLRQLPVPRRFQAKKRVLQPALFS